MFTGLIEALCRVKSIRKTEDSAQLTINLGKLAADVKIGESIAVNGACLTVAALHDNFATFDASSETLKKTNLGTLRVNAQVNIERAMKATGRFGGHFVSGHIDGIAMIKSIRYEGQFASIKYTASTELIDQIIPQGSIAIDGISLTVTHIEQGGFTVMIIPETIEKTTLGTAKVNNKSNIEIDLIVKTVIKQMEKILPKKQNLTIEKLKESGF
jgi:riboflavin synthase